MWGYLLCAPDISNAISGDHIRCLAPDVVVISGELELACEVTVLNLQDEYVSVIELRFIFPFQQFIDLPGTLLS